MIEHLNAEICLHTIRDISVAIQWVKSTFLNVRIRKNPHHYLTKKDASKEIDVVIKEICLKHLNELTNVHLVQMDEAMCLQPTGNN